MQAIFQSISTAINNLFQNMGRTVVTLIGIVLSVSAIIMVMSAGESVKQFILDQLGIFGTDIIQVEPRVPSGTTGQDRSASGTVNALTSITTLTLEDGEAIERLDNVRAVAGGSFGQEQVKYGRERNSTMIFGSSASMEEVDENVVVIEGRFFTQQEDKGLSQVVVLGFGLKEKLFGESTAIGEKVDIGGQGYRVVGILRERGGAGFLDFDDMAYIPIQTLQKKILGIDYVTFLTIRVEDVDQIQQTTQNVRALLRSRHDIYDIRDDDFEAVSVAEGQELIEEVFGAISVLLLALASVSLVVGGVGIMNVMFVAMEERISEIGLRKALGARSKDVLLQFLTESVVISLFGAVIGLLLGITFVGLIVLGLSYAGIEVAFGVTQESLLVSIVFSVIAGIVFGLYPAYRASKIVPTEAMRK
jgi:ABC-type antimicrobial peptide transport system permease subunit